MDHPQDSSMWWHTIHLFIHSWIQLARTHTHTHARTHTPANPDHYPMREILQFQVYIENPEAQRSEETCPKKYKSWVKNWNCNLTLFQLPRLQFFCLGSAVTVSDSRDHWSFPRGRFLRTLLQLPSRKVSLRVGGSREGTYLRSQI